MKNQNQNLNAQKREESSHMNYSGKRSGFHPSRSFSNSSISSSDSLPIGVESVHVYTDSDSDTQPPATVWLENDDEDDANGKVASTQRQISGRSSRLPANKKARKIYRHHASKKSTHTSFSTGEDSDSEEEFDDITLEGVEVEDLNDIALESAYSHGEQTSKRINIPNHAAKSKRSRDISAKELQSDSNSFENDDTFADSDQITGIGFNDSDNSVKDNDSTEDSETEGSESDSSDSFDSDASSDFENALARRHKEKQIKKKLQPPPKLLIPKRLDPSTFRISNISKSQNNGDFAFDDEDDESISDLSVMSESELDALEASIPQFRRRRDSVVDQALDDGASFPRSIISGSIPEESFDENDSDEFNEADGDRLLAVLGSDFESSTAEADHSSDDSISDDEDDGDIEKDFGVADFKELPSDPNAFFAQDDGEADDDEALEAEEERALLEEIERSGDFDHPSAVMMMGYESEDDVFDSDLSFDNESFFSRPLHQNAMEADKSHSKNSDDDDSYLWSYFFTSDEESSSEESENGLPVNGHAVNPSFDSGLYYNDMSEDSGESTDEDENLPRRTNKAPFSKPTEILSSSTTATRPPILGSWVMSTERPFGIIDGRTTRTLSPPGRLGVAGAGDSSPLSLKRSYTEPMSSNMTKLKRAKSSKADTNVLKKSLTLDDSLGGNSAENMSLASTLVAGDSNETAQKLGSEEGGQPIDAANTNKTNVDDSESDLSELALDDFINTSELDDDDEDDNDDKNNKSDNNAAYDFYGRLMNRDIPLSAFRNRGLSAYSHSSLQSNAYIATLSHHGRRKSHSHRSRRASSVSSLLSSSGQEPGVGVGVSDGLTVGKKSRKNSSVNGNGISDLSSSNFFSGLVLPSIPHISNVVVSRNPTPSSGEDRRNSLGPMKDIESMKSYAEADLRDAMVLKRNQTTSLSVSSVNGVTGSNGNSKKLRKKKRKQNARNKLLDETFGTDGRAGSLDVGSLGDLTIDIELLGADFVVDDVSGLGALSPLFGGIA